MTAADEKMYRISESELEEWEAGGLCWNEEKDLHAAIRARGPVEHEPAPCGSNPGECFIKMNKRIVEEREIALNRLDREIAIRENEMNRKGNLEANITTATGYITAAGALNWVRVVLIDALRSGGSAPGSNPGEQEQRAELPPSMPEGGTDPMK